MPPRVVANQPVFLSTAPAAQGDRKLAFAVILLSLLIFLSLAPFAQVPLPRVFGFVPMYESAIAISDLVTVAILFIQYNILRSYALLALICGYLFTALMAVSHSLTFPGLFSPEGLLGAGSQSTAWLYVFWHGGFPIAVIAYSLLSERNNTTDTPAKSAWPIVLVSISGVVASVVGLTALVTIGHALLPNIMTGGFNNSGLVRFVAVDLLLTGAGLVILRAYRAGPVADGGPVCVAVRRGAQCAAQRHPLRPRLLRRPPLRIASCDIRFADAAARDRHALFAARQALRNGAA
ncbi:MAG: MASE4 domain-containing protein [Xanthobacteraceae bacterium]